MEDNTASIEFFEDGTVALEKINEMNGAIYEIVMIRP